MGAKAAVVEERKAIPSHSTDTSDDAWDGPAQEAKLSNDAGAETYRKAYGWVDPDKDPDTKAAYKFIHHFVGDSGSIGLASTKGCSSGIGVLNGGRSGADIPDEDRQGVYNHLARHLRDADQEPPPLALAPSGATERRYQHVTHYVADAVWAMHPTVLATVLAIVAERRSGHTPGPEEIRARIGAGGRERRSSELVVADGVAVIPINGPIVPKAAMVDDVSGPGTTSIEGLRAKFREALAMPEASAIVLNVDSPGGSVDLVPEMAAEIMAARGQKPIVAVANTWAASAAYWLASAADKLVVTPSGEVGSIGVYSAHDDLSAAMAMKGIKTTLVSAGDYKVEGNPFEPLSTSARAEMQSKVDAFYRMFVGAVASQRGVSEQTVEEQFGQGRLVMATDAVARGMADAVGTLEETVAGLGRASATAEPPLSARSSPIVITSRGQVPDDAPVLVKRLVRMEREVRVMPGGGVRPVELREAGDQLELVGYAALYDVEYEVEDAYGSYIEKMARGCFTKTLSDGADVRLLINHDDLPLARTKSGTLSLLEDEVGLRVQAWLDRSDPDVKRIVPKMARKDLREMSHARRPIRQEWDASYTHRTLLEVKLYDVSIVTFAASTSTWSDLRTAEVLEHLAAMDPRELAVELRSAGGLHMLEAAIDTLQAVRDGARSDDPDPGRDSPPTMSVDMAQRLLDLGRGRSR